jgi:hypothetical protein
VLTLAGATGGDITVSAADDYKVDISADDMKKFDPILAIERMESEWRQTISVHSS